MSWYTDWFLADESEAEAVAGIGSDDGHDFEDWPHLAMRSVGEMELMALLGVLRGQPAEMDDVHGDALYHQSDEDGGVVVVRVTPSFVADLAALTADRATQAARQWHQSESMADWGPATVAEVLGEMVAFARRAVQEGKPVLQLSTW